MALSYAEQFSPSAAPGREILNAGSLILVGNLANNLDLEPQVHTLTAAAAIIGDETISLTSDQTATFLRKGTVLHFPAATAVVTEDATVTSSATDVPVEALEGAITAGDEATTWALLRLLSPMNIPFNIENQTTDRTDLNTIDGSTVKVKRDFKPQISAFARPDDKALWEVIFPAAEGTGNIYVNIIRSSGQHAFGVAQVEGYNSDGAQSEIDKPQFTLSFQGKKALTAPYAYLTTGKQALLNSVMKLSGMNIYS